MIDLQAMTENFVARWRPSDACQSVYFLMDLRALLEAYGKAALMHESLPDTEHEHGDPA